MYRQRKRGKPKGRPISQIASAAVIGTKCGQTQGACGRASQKLRITALAASPPSSVMFTAMRRGKDERGRLMSWL
jgi:hypothetical protein